MTTHVLKTHPEPFTALISGRKTHEYRLNDRSFQLDDVLDLREWCPVKQEFTGRQAHYLVTYIMRGPEYGIPAGYCIMSVIPDFLTDPVLEIKTAS